MNFFLNNITRCLFVVVLISVMDQAAYAQITGEPVQGPPIEPVIYTRPITVTVDVIDPLGDPIADVPLQAITKYGIVFGATDASGQAVLQLRAAPSRDRSVMVRLFDGHWHRELTEAEKFHYLERFRTLMETYSFYSRYSVEINAQSNSYTYVLQANESVSLTGRFVDGTTGDPQWRVVGRAYPYEPQFFTSDDGAFELSVAKGESTELIYEIPDTHQIKVHTISAAQTQADLSLGDIPLTALAEDAQVSVSYLHPNDHIVDPKSLTTTKSFVTMISQDGSVVLTYFANNERTAAVNQSWDVDETPPQVPPGTYYIACGPYSSDTIRALRLAIIGGRQILLDAAGVAKVSVASGGQASVTLDVQSNIDAILSVASDLID